MLRDELDNGRPVIYSGGHLAIDDTYGHTFICDGYGHDGDDNLFHFNWGWRGDHNDEWFTIGSLNPGDDEYNFLNSGLFDVHPNWYIDCNTTINLCEYYWQYENDFIDYHGYPPPPPWTYDAPIAGNIIGADESCWERYRMIPEGGATRYRAYNSIVLKPGFHVDAGGTFSAEIIPCPNDCGSMLKSLKINNVNTPVLSDFQYIKSNQSIDSSNTSNINVLEDKMIKIYPNPFREFVNITIDNPTNDYITLWLHTSKGELIKSVKGYYPKGIIELELYLNDLNSGIYFLLLKVNGNFESVKIIKQ